MPINVDLWKLDLFQSNLIFFFMRLHVWLIKVTMSM